MVDEAPARHTTSAIDGAPPASIEQGREQPSAEAASPRVYLRVAEALEGDIDHGIARIDPLALDALGLRPGDPLLVTGQRSTVLRGEPDAAASGRHMIRLDGLLRDNVQAGIDARVSVQAAAPSRARFVLFASPVAADLDDEEIEQIHREVTGRVLSAGDRVRVIGLDRGPLIVEVLRIEPDGPAIVATDTGVQTQAVADSGD